MGESFDSIPNSERHNRTTERATAALGVRRVMPSSSQMPEASTRPASSYRPTELVGAPAASCLRTSEANEDSLAHLPRQQPGVVPDTVAALLREQILLRQAQAHLPQPVPIDHDGRGVLDLVTGESARRQVSRMDENVCDDRPDVFSDRPHVVGDREVARLTLLGHHVRDVDDRAREFLQGLPHPAAEEGRYRAGKKAPRTEQEHVSTFYGLDDPLGSWNSGWLHGDLRDLFSGLVDHGLPTRHGSIGVAHHERQALHRGRKDATFDPQEPGGLLHALAEPPGHVREGGDNDVADAVVVQVPRRLETVVEDLGQPAAPRERDQAAPDVAGRRDPQLLAKASARASVISDRDHRRKVADPVSQAPEQYGQAGAAAKRHYLQVLDATHGARVYRPPESPRRRLVPVRAAR